MTLAAISLPPSPTCVSLPITEIQHKADEYLDFCRQIAIVESYLKTTRNLSVASSLLSLKNSLYESRPLSERAIAHTHLVCFGEYVTGYSLDAKERRVYMLLSKKAPAELSDRGPSIEPTTLRLRYELRALASLQRSYNEQLAYLRPKAQDLPYTSQDQSEWIKELRNKSFSIIQEFVRPLANWDFIPAVDNDPHQLHTQEKIPEIRTIKALAISALSAYSSNIVQGRLGPYCRWVAMRLHDSTEPDGEIGAQIDQSNIDSSTKKEQLSNPDSHSNIHILYERLDEESEYEHYTWNHIDMKETIGPAQRVLSFGCVERIIALHKRLFSYK